VSQVAAMKHMVDDFAIYARQPRPGQLQPCRPGALLLDVLALYDNLRPHVVLSLPDARRDPGRTHPSAPGVPQSPPECGRCPGRRRGSPLRDRLASDGNEARSSFADNGPGFGADVIAHAFEPYVTTKAKGTGLGLAIVKKIVDEHGGRVTLENASPRGARVTLTFPAVAARGAAAA
jgi:nitrogen fixation/metabolism regulation signal transduction histidine kinase